jgi:hypothetical protein
MLSDAFIEVTCDGCHTVEVVPLTATAGHGWDERNVARHLASIGWTANGDEHWCDECTKINRCQPS